MATRIKNIVRFTGLVAGVPTSLPHGLTLPPTDRAVVPDVLFPSAPGYVITADATNITVTRLGGGASVDVLCEVWHTIERAFGAYGVLDLVPKPIVPGGDSGAAGGSFMLFGGTLDVFVDAANGSDANTGLSTASPLQTLEAVYRRFPIWALGGGQITVNLAGVGGFGAAATGQLTYTDRSVVAWTGDAVQPSYAYRGPQMVPVTPASGPNTAALDGVPAVAVGQRTRLDFVGAAPGWTVNDLAGRFLRVTRAGVKVFYELPISENDGDQIFVDVLGIVGVLLATDTVTIVEPGARIDPAPNVLGVFGSLARGGSFAQQASHFERIAFGESRFNGDLAFDRCQFTNATELHGMNRMVNCAGRFTAGTPASVICTGGIDTQNIASRDDAAGNPINTAVQVAWTSFGLGVALGQSPWGSCYLSGARNIGIYGAFGTGLFVEGPGSQLVMFGGIALLGAGNGAGAASPGLRARHGGRARVNGGALTTITGSSGALQVDTGAVVAYGAGAGQFEEVAGFNGNLHRLGGSTATVPLGDMSQITTLA